jgi:hypothetical protein
MADESKNETRPQSHASHASQAADREARTKVAERPKGRPTPTQEELDQLALGHHVELSDDGSGPDPVEKLNTVRRTYQHRQLNPRG